MIEPITALAAIIPTVQYVISRVTDYYTGGPKPSNAQEQIDILRTETERLNALAQLDNSDGASTWVHNIRSLMRPLAAFMILSAWYVIAIKTGVTIDSVENLAAAVIFYLFGERVQMRLPTNRGK